MFVGHIQREKKIKESVFELKFHLYKAIYDNDSLT